MEYCTVQVFIFSCPKLSTLCTSYKNTQQIGLTQKPEINGIFYCLRPLYDVCACMYTVYVRAMQMICRSTLMIDGVASLALLLQSTLCSQSLAACCDVSNPVFEVFRKLRAFDLHTEKKSYKGTKKRFVFTLRKIHNIVGKSLSECNHIFSAKILKNSQPL